jgi:hypothetical protein
VEATDVIDALEQAKPVMRKTVNAIIGQLPKA